MTSSTLAAADLSMGVRTPRPSGPPLRIRGRAGDGPDGQLADRLAAIASLERDGRFSGRVIAELRARARADAEARYRREVLTAAAPEHQLRQPRCDCHDPGVFGHVPGCRAGLGMPSGGPR